MSRCLTSAAAALRLVVKRQPNEHHVMLVSGPALFRWTVWMLGLGIVMAWSACSASDAPAAIDYLRQIRPILQARCYACHGALKQESQLRLDTVQLAIKGGESGAAVTPGDAAGSVLWQRVKATDPDQRMPPEGEPLQPDQLRLIEAWIASGAAAPADEQPERDPRDHWAFQPPQRPEIPSVADAAWSRNPIDAFLAAEQEKKGIVHQTPAPRRILLRRLAIDLVGLPPTLDQQQAFLTDTSERAWDNVVEELLASPHYGERWGRHWMDVWRYSDWWGLGAEVRNSQKNIWHWRDWIIESLNEDRGYDEMLREMLAADELHPGDLNRLRATGYLARQYFKFNRTSWLDETIEHTSKAMLGLTFNCSKCHDHKYDPIRQEDYYRLRAVFEPYQIRMEQIPGELDPERNAIPRAFDCHPDMATYVHLRGDDRNPDKSRPMSPGVPEVLQFSDWNVVTVDLPPEAVHPGLRPFVLQNHLEAAERRMTDAGKALKTAQDQQQRLQKPVPSEKTPPSADGEAAAGQVIVEEAFDAERPELWETVGGQWDWSEGDLVQSQDGPDQVGLRLKQAVPEDFEAELQFTLTGGRMWKSAGIVFDEVPPAENLVYMSATSSGPKVQVSWTTDGRHAYPRDGAVARLVELNKPYRLKVRVRGTLVNVLVDDQLAIAFRLPVPRRPGAVRLMTFDAQARFHRFRLKHLAAAEVLVTPSAGTSGDSGVMTAELADRQVVVAEQELAVALAEPAVLRARAAADRARFQRPPADNAVALMSEAARLERAHTLAKSDADVARAELDLLRAVAGKKADAEKQLTAARTRRDLARAAVEKQEGDYTPLSGALKTLESNLETEESRRKPFPSTSTGRRTAFAAWLTDRRHPLTARVAVNHIWMRHMGTPLVPTVFDFGRKGTPPTHPQLLDWLAVELMESGWSMKHIHRLIVTSQAYRMSSSVAGADETTTEIDPENRLYWRANPLRMEAQVVRDALLHLAGDLDLTFGGPPLPVRDETSRRRSIYFVHSHNEHHTFLSMFDDANVLDCYRRAQSIVPQQALALENSPLASRMAETMASRMAAADPEGSDRQFLQTAFRTILCADPGDQELAAALDALTRLTALATDAARENPKQRARQQVIQALLNHNDFVTVR